MKFKYSNVLPYTIVAITVSSVLQWSELNIGNTLIWWIIYAAILFIFIKIKINTPTLKKTSFPTINLFLAWLLFSAIYGATVMATDYWEWKLLVNNLLIFSLPIATYVYCNPSNLSKTLLAWLKYAPIIYVFLFPFLAGDAHGRYLVPFSLLALFLFKLENKYKILIIICYVWICIVGLDSRSDVLKFTVCLSLNLFYILEKRKSILKAALSITHITLFVAPILFFILAVSGTFNIFQVNEYLPNTYMMKDSEGNEYSATSDTRTFLYKEEITSAIKHNYVLTGHSIARGYESATFGEDINKAQKSRKGERGSCETSILNIFNYFGIIGVMLYLAIFIHATSLAIYKSNNIYIKVIGIYVSFRWLFAWIEDFSTFSINYLFLWIMIAMCLSSSFRHMSNRRFAIWIRNSLPGNNNKKTIKCSSI